MSPPSGAGITDRSSYHPTITWISGDPNSSPHTCVEYFNRQASSPAPQMFSICLECITKCDRWVATCACVFHLARHFLPAGHSILPNLHPICNACLSIQSSHTCAHLFLGSPLSLPSASPYSAKMLKHCYIFSKY